MSGYETRQIIRSQWTLYDDWYNEPLYKQYTQAALDAIRGLNAGITTAAHNPRHDYDNAREIGYIQFLIGIWSPIVAARGGLTIRILPDARHIFLIGQHAENELLLPVRDYQSNAYTETTEKLRQALQAEFLKLEERLESQGILPIILPQTKRQLRKLYGLEKVQRHSPEKDDIGKNDTETQAIVNSILVELRSQSISLGEMQRTLDALRRVLKAVQQTGLPVDAETKRSLDEIYNAVNSNMDFGQQLQLSVPLIPFLLSYNLTLDGSVDLGAVWNEWKARLHKKTETYDK